MATITLSSETILVRFKVMIFFSVLFLLAFCCKVQSGQLPKEEVDALKEIADQLGIKDNLWNFSLNPCDGKWDASSLPSSIYNRSIFCNCSFPGGVCHVEQIFLKGQDLGGELPRSLPKLQYLKIMDFSRNCLSGTIPKEWVSLNLELLTFGVNNLSGPIPAFLGDMTTLKILWFENNMFNGTVPAALGKLVNLESLVFSANSLTGELPEELYNLTKLTELRLSSNNFTGKLPTFSKWKNLQKLEVQASGFEGPIPSEISTLKNLTELRISDLKGSASPFPPLRDLTNMEKLMLRSCNLSGKINLPQMPSLKTLDLSFNNLDGEVPNLEGIQPLKSIYLTGNSLSGKIPDWIKNANERQIDLSYNNFSKNSVPETCRENLNLYRSYGRGNHSDLAACLSPCSKVYYSVYINCGGSATNVGENTFESDEESAGSAKWVHAAEHWGTSSTGEFWAVKGNMDYYTANNVSILSMNDSQLYMTARLSPLSLTYYARCLANGNYTVTLHFAEIVLRDNRSFQSVGRRMFDVYIQDEQKLKDFDIENEAHGVDKVVKPLFKAVSVKNRTLEIRFQYAGRGSTAVPRRGTYGPLISAISIESEFQHPSSIQHPHSMKGKILIAVVSVASAFLFILIVLYFTSKKYHKRDKISRERDLKGIDLRTGLFTYRQIRAATDDFSAANKIGEGGFGAVYKGTLLDGTTIAVKQLSPKSNQGSREFVNEIGMISGLQHPNVVRLYGCCIEGSQLLLVYEYLENNSLAHALFGSQNWQLELDWPTRQNICVGIAKGLAFLHDESALRIVHRDIKTTNILLDKEFNPKISDFGLAKLDEEENTHISTRVAGTIGYMAPEYALWGHLTYKADVYSFGVVALEIVAGKNNMHYQPSEEYVCLLDWALVLQKRGNLVELVDPRLGSNFDKKEAVRMIKVALLCTNPSPALRPNMSAVVGMLEGLISTQEYVSEPSVYNDGLNLQSLRDKMPENGSTVNSSDTKESSTFSTKCQDLYAVSLDSQ